MKKEVSIEEQVVISIFAKYEQAKSILTNNNFQEQHIVRTCLESFIK